MSFSKLGTGLKEFMGLFTGFWLGLVWFSSGMVTYLFDFWPFSDSDNSSMAWHMISQVFFLVDEYLLI